MLLVIRSVTDVLRTQSRFIKFIEGGGEAEGGTPTHFTNLLSVRSTSVTDLITNLKWCIHLSRSFFSYFNYLVSVTAGGPRSPRGHM